MGTGISAARSREQGLLGRQSILSLLLHTDLWAERVSPPNSYGKALSPTVMAPGRRAFVR